MPTENSSTRVTQYLSSSRKTGNANIPQVTKKYWSELCSYQDMQVSIVNQKTSIIKECWLEKLSQRTKDADAC